MNLIQKDVWNNVIFPRLSVNDFYKFRGASKTTKYICDQYPTHEMHTIKQKKRLNIKIKNALLTNNLVWLRYYTYDFTKYILTGMEPYNTLSLVLRKNMSEAVLQYYRQMNINNLLNMFCRVNWCVNYNDETVHRILDIIFMNSGSLPYQKIYERLSELNNHALKIFIAYPRHSLHYYLIKILIIKKHSILKDPNFLQSINHTIASYKELVALSLRHNVGEPLKLYNQWNDVSCINLLEYMLRECYYEYQTMIPTFKYIYYTRRINFSINFVKRLINKMTKNEMITHMATVTYFVTTCHRLEIYRLFAWKMEDDAIYFRYIETLFPNVDHEYEKNFIRAVNAGLKTITEYYALRLIENKLDIPQIANPPPSMIDTLQRLYSIANKRRKSVLETE